MSALFLYHDSGFKESVFPIRFCTCFRLVLISTGFMLWGLLGDYSLSMFLRFGVREWLSMLPMSPAQAAEQDAMVEGLLTFLAILVSSRTNLGWYNIND